MKRIGILAEDLAGGCLVTVDYSKKAGFPRIAKCIYSVNPCQTKTAMNRKIHRCFSFCKGDCSLCLTPTGIYVLRAVRWNRYAFGRYLAAFAQNRSRTYSAISIFCVSESANYWCCAPFLCIGFMSVSELQQKMKLTFFLGWNVHLIFWGIFCNRPLSVSISLRYF